MSRPIRRCALYTRKSSEEGLEQGFNSLHAQRAACGAYVCKIDRLSRSLADFVRIVELFDRHDVSSSASPRHSTPPAAWVG